MRQRLERRVGGLFFRCRGYFGNEVILVPRSSGDFIALALNVSVIALLKAKEYCNTENTYDDKLYTDNNCHCCACWCVNVGIIIYILSALSSLFVLP